MTRRSGPDDDPHHPTAGRGAHAPPCGIMETDPESVYQRTHHVITVHTDTWARLKSLKDHPRQSFNEVIAELLDAYEAHRGDWLSMEADGRPKRSGPPPPREGPTEPTKDAGVQGPVVKAEPPEPCPMCGKPMKVTGRNVVLGNVNVGTTWACVNPRCFGFNSKAGAGP